MSMTDFQKNYEEVSERIARACARSVRKPDEVTLVAVSKYVPTERMQEAYDLGVRTFGENHAQEVHQKQTFFEQPGCGVHFIGHLQTNKLKYVCGSVAIIESLDRVSLLEALRQKQSALGQVADVLIQVNIGDEAQKGGVALTELEPFAEQVANSECIRLRGLMCVPPALSPEETRPYFTRMRALFEKMRATYRELPFDTLSMGMSHDYDVAILEGATEVRVGSALFGARDRK